MDERYGSPGLPSGWTRQGVQAPINVTKLFKAAGAREGHGGVKWLGTLGLALVAGAPHRVRDELVEFIWLKGRHSPNDVKPSDVWDRLVELVRAQDEGGEWYIDRIIDPEVSPKPGEKASDKDKPRRKGGAA